MKILIPILGKFGNVGGWRVLSELANNWIAQGHEVTMLVHKSSMNPYFPTVAQIIWYDNDGCLVDGNDINYEWPAFRIFSIAVAMVKAINRCTADIILANQSQTALPVLLSKIDARKFYYVQAYEPDYYNGYHPKKMVFKILSKLSYKYNLRKIVNSEFYLNYREIKTDMYVYPGLNLDIFSRSIGAARSRNEKFIVGTIGRVEKYKGTQYILNAFSKLRKEYGDLVELHIGFGNIHNIDGVKNITIKGDQQLADFYRSLNVYVCAGTIQLGAVHYPIIESMACGTPVITTGYLPANDSNAWIVPIKDEDSILSNIITVKNNPEFAEQKANVASASVQIFDWKVVSQKMLQYFNSVEEV